MRQRRQIIANYEALQAVFCKAVGEGKGHGHAAVQLVNRCRPGVLVPARQGRIDRMSTVKSVPAGDSRHSQMGCRCNRTIETVRQWNRTGHRGYCPSIFRPKLLIHSVCVFTKIYIPTTNDLPGREEHKSVCNDIVKGLDFPRGQIVVSLVPSLLVTFLEYFAPESINLSLVVSFEHLMTFRRTVIVTVSGSGYLIAGRQTQKLLVGCAVQHMSLRYSLPVQTDQRNPTQRKLAVPSSSNQ